MSAHTPGPWAYIGQIVQGPHGEEIATTRLERYTTDERRSANTRLIAASPELLDALRALVGWHDCFSLKDGEADLPVVVRARAAIAKAEGRP